MFFASIKKNNMKTYYLKSLIFALIVATFFNCSDNNNSDNELTLSCEIENSTFRQLYQDIMLDSSVIEYTQLDAEVHGYTFEVSANKQICSIGYQSFAPDPTTPYKIEIIDNSDGTQIYYGEHIFSQTDMSYIQLSTPIDISDNSTYTIKRTQDIWTSIGEVVGRAIEKFDNIQSYDILPHTFGDLTILSAGQQGISNDTVFPYSESLIRLPLIDIVFME